MLESFGIQEGKEEERQQWNRHGLELVAQVMLTSCKSVPFGRITRIAVPSL